MQTIQIPKNTTRLKLRMLRNLMFCHSRQVLACIGVFLAFGSVNGFSEEAAPLFQSGSFRNLQERFRKAKNFELSLEPYTQAKATSAQSLAELFSFRMPEMGSLREKLRSAKKDLANLNIEIEDEIKSHPNRIEMPKDWIEKMTAIEGKLAVAAVEEHRLEWQTSEAVNRVCRVENGLLTTTVLAPLTGFVGAISAGLHVGILFDGKKKSPSIEETGEKAPSGEREMEVELAPSAREVSQAGESQSPSLEQEQTDGPLGPEQISQAIDQEINEKLKEAGLEDWQKKAIRARLTDQKYLEKLQGFYEKMFAGAKGTHEQRIEKIQKNLDAALTKMVTPRTAEKKQATGEPEFSLDLDDENSVGQKTASSAPNETPKSEQALEATSFEAAKKQQEQRKIERAKAKEAEEKRKNLLEQAKKDFENPAAAEKPAVAPSKPLKLPELSRQEKAVLNSKKARSTAALAETAQKALSAFKEGKEIGIGLADFFIDGETNEKTEKSHETINDAQFKKLYETWLRHEKKYAQMVKDSKAPPTEKIMAVLKELNHDFIFQYVLPLAHVTDLLEGKGGNCVAETKLITAVLNDLGLKPDPSQVLGVQVFDDHVQAVLYDKTKDEVTLLVDGSKQKGLIAPVYKPELLLRQYLESVGSESPMKPEDFLIQDLSKEIREKALAAASVAESSGVTAIMRQNLGTNTGLNFPKTGIYFSTHSPPQVQGTISWSSGGSRTSASEFYDKGGAEIDTALWKNQKEKTEHYAPQHVDWAGAEKEMKALFSSSNYREFLALKKNPALLAQKNYDPAKIKEFGALQDSIYEILDNGAGYVTGDHLIEAQANLRKRLVAENPEIQSLYEILKQERDAFHGASDSDVSQKQKSFDFFKALGPEKWVLYKKLQAPRVDESALAEALGKPPLSLASPLDLDHYFFQLDKVSFEAKYRQSLDGSSPATTSAMNAATDGPMEKNKGAHGGAPALTGNGNDPSGSAFKPEPAAPIKLSSLEFAQFIEQATTSQNTSLAARFTPALTAALRDQKQYTKDFVEWFTSSGITAVAEAREKNTRVVSGPYHQPIPKDLAVLLVDFLNRKDKTGADLKPVLAQIEKNYGSVRNYLTQLKSDFGGKEAKTGQEGENNDDALEVFQKIAAEKNLDPAIFDRAEKKSFRFKNRSAETFLMGSPIGEHGDDDELQHQVQIQNSYRIQVTPVTQLEWFLVMGANPSSNIAEDGDHDHQKINGIALNMNHPVEQVSPDQIKLFLKKLEAFDKRCSYRLPTEAEWEAAARAHTSTAYSFGNNPSEDGGKTLQEYAWFLDNSDQHSHAVAQKRPNGEGLYDMAGNVWQRVVAPEYSPPQATEMVRGGSFGDAARQLRSANRELAGQESPQSQLGFRMVRTCPDH